MVQLGDLNVVKELGGNPRKVHHQHCAEGEIGRVDDADLAILGVLAEILDLRRVDAGFAFREAYAQCRAAETDRFGYGLIVLGALVMVAPLLGLLGTVLGMIQTFDAVATNSSETADLVAGGISKALITTQVGLVAALPGTLGLAHVFRLYRRLTNAVDLCETQLSLLFEHATESQEGAA